MKINICLAPGNNAARRRDKDAHGVRRICKASLVLVAIGALLALLGTAVVSSAATGQQADDAVRIVARKLANGRIEFGLQQRHTDNSWGDRQLPRVRFFPTTARVDRWLASSPLTVPVGEVRIVARKLANGRIEFGLQQRHSDNSWGDRQLPRVRFFPTTARVDRWLASSPISLSATQPPPPHRAPRRQPDSPRSPPEATTRAGCAAMAPSPAGAT